MDALNTVGGSSCYLSLYTAFEKAVNADKNRTGKDFDIAGSFLTGLPETDIKSLRKFNNLLKHVVRNQQESQRFINKESQFGQLIRNLKMAADKAILNRI